MPCVTMSIQSNSNIKHKPRFNKIVFQVYCFPWSWILEKTLKTVYGQSQRLLLLRLHHKPSSSGLVLFCPFQAVLIWLWEMLFLTVPGGTASLQLGLFMGSPGMYIRGFLGREEASEKGFGGVWSLSLADVESPGVVFCLCISIFLSFWGPILGLTCSVEIFVLQSDACVNLVIETVKSVLKVFNNY